MIQIKYKTYRTPDQSIIKIFKRSFYYRSSNSKNNVNFCSSILSKMQFCQGNKRNRMISESLSNIQNKNKIQKLHLEIIVDDREYLYKLTFLIR